MPIKGSHIKIKNAEVSLTEAFAKELDSLLSNETAFEIPLFGGLAVHSSIVVTWVIMAVLTLAAFILTRNLQLVPVGKRQLAAEGIVSFINNLIGGLVGSGGKAYIPFIGTVLLYLACTNTIGIIGITPPTKDLNVTCALALMSIALIEISGVRARGVGGWLKSFTEPLSFMVFLNVMEIALRPLSLCLRLFGNILGGFIIMELVKFEAPLLLPIPLSLYFDIFDGLIQAYVFVLLTSLFTSESIGD